MVDTESGLEVVEGELVDEILDALESCDAWELDPSVLARIGGAK